MAFSYCGDAIYFREAAAFFRAGFCGIGICPCTAIAYFIAFVTAARDTLELRRAILMVRSFGSAMIEWYLGPPNVDLRTTLPS